jgi:hypothetical protein
MKKVLTILCMLTFLSMSTVSFARPKYSANVPKSAMTPDVIKTKMLGTLEFFDGSPTDETVKKVYDNLDFLRGVETFLNGIPAASIYALLEGFKDAGVGPYTIAITENLLDARSLFLTPNSTTMYMSVEINVKDEPFVMEVPPMVLGPVDDAFFRWVTDIGITGPDQGRGGRYLFVGPDYDGEIPDGYHVIHSPTYRNFLLMRAFVKDGDLAATAKAVKSVFRAYPLSKVNNPPKQKFVNISGKKFNTVHSNDFSFFEELNAVVQYEPADAFNPELVGLFASIGIKKGQPFKPDARMKKILTEAVAIGNATGDFELVK